MSARKNREPEVRAAPLADSMDDAPVLWPCQGQRSPHDGNARLPNAQARGRLRSVIDKVLVGVQSALRCE